MPDRVSASTSHSDPLVETFIRNHPFMFVSSLSSSTSQRRAFLRDVHDFAKGRGLSSAQANQAVQLARTSTGGDASVDSDCPFENEVDDSKAVLASLAKKARINLDENAPQGDGTIAQQASPRSSLKKARQVNSAPSASGDRSAEALMKKG